MTRKRKSGRQANRPSDRHINLGPTPILDKASFNESCEIDAATIGRGAKHIRILLAESDHARGGKLRHCSYRRADAAGGLVVQLPVVVEVRDAAGSTLSSGLRGSIR